MHPTSRELDSIRSLLQDNGESPLSLLLQDAISNDPTPVGGMRGSAEVWPQPPPQEAMTALVGLLRAKDRDSMQVRLTVRGRARGRGRGKGRGVRVRARARVRVRVLGLGLG